MEMNRSGELLTLKLCPAVKVFKRAERLSSCWTDDRPETTSAEILILLELFSLRSARRFSLVNDPRILSAFSLRFDIGWRRSSCLSRCLSSEVEKIIQLDEVSRYAMTRCYFQCVKYFQDRDDLHCEWRSGVGSLVLGNMWFVVDARWTRVLVWFTMLTNR